MKDLRTIILAAGKGTRMKSRLPKVLHCVCGKTIISLVVDLARAVGSLKTCVVLGHQSDKIKDHLSGNIHVVIQEKLLGTADAVLSASNSLKGFHGDVLILSGDAPLFRKETIKALLRKHKKAQAACTFLTAVVRDSYGYGRVIRGSSGEAIAIREEKDATDYEKNIVEINAGVYCFNCRILLDVIKQIKLNKRKKEYYLTDIIEILSEKGYKVEVVEADDASESLGINTKEDLAQAEAVMRGRILRDFMLSGITIIDPQTTFIGMNVRIGRDTLINPFTVIEDNVCIGSNCTIGPFARLRTGTKLKDNVTIGNFTEVSRTEIGEHSIMKHFGFLGDAKVGKSVNVGAGVVTANYDGKNKNKTHILDKAFIGSDSILVAPVKIGRKALTGAGCVVTKGTNVGDNAVVVGVPGRIKNNKK